MCNLRKKFAIGRRAPALHLPLRAQVLHQEHVACLGIVHSIELFLITTGLSCHLSEELRPLAAFFFLHSIKFLRYFRVPYQQQRFSLLHFFGFIPVKGVIFEKLDIQTASRPAEQVVDIPLLKHVLDSLGFVVISDGLKSLTKSRLTSSASILSFFFRCPLSSKSL